MNHIQFAFQSTRFGFCLVATVDTKICHLSFWNPEDRSTALELLQQEWPRASMQEVQYDDVDSFFHSSKDLSSSVVLKGTPFQQEVWRALLEIPFGQTTSYEAIAKAIGRPTATRAVANAIGSNRISFLIPCHRVIAKSGKLGGYRWGIELKKQLLQWEQAEAH